jgi:hypothetical protein
MAPRHLSRPTTGRLAAADFLTTAAFVLFSSMWGEAALRLAPAAGVSAFMAGLTVLGLGLAAFGPATRAAAALAGTARGPAPCFNPAHSLALAAAGRAVGGPLRSAAARGLAQTAGAVLGAATGVAQLGGEAVGLALGCPFRRQRLGERAAAGHHRPPPRRADRPAVEQDGVAVAVGGDRHLGVEALQVSVPSRWSAAAGMSDASVTTACAPAAASSSGG